MRDGFPQATEPCPRVAPRGCLKELGRREQDQARDRSRSRVAKQKEPDAIPGLVSEGTLVVAVVSRRLDVVELCLRQIAHIPLPGEHSRRQFVFAHVEVKGLEESPDLKKCLAVDQAGALWEGVGGKALGWRWPFLPAPKPPVKCSNGTVGDPIPPPVRIVNQSTDYCESRL